MIPLILLALTQPAFAVDNTGKSIICTHMPGPKKKLKSGKYSLEYKEVTQLPKIEPNMGGQCDYNRVDWNTQWVYLVKFACVGISDLFAIMNYKNDTLSLELRRQDPVSKTRKAQCNALAGCSKQVMGVILKKGQKVSKVNVAQRNIPCP